MTARLVEMRIRGLRTLADVTLQLDRAQLDKWTDQYSGLGELRAAGQLCSVIGVDEDAA